MPTAVEYILSLEGIVGELAGGAMSVESFSWGASLATNGGAFGSGGGAGRASFQDFTFVMRANKASPQLMLACVTGKHLKQGIFTGRLATANLAPEFYHVTLMDVLVTSFKDMSNDQVGDNYPMTHVSLNFAKISYQVQGSTRDGVAPPVANFDLQRNAPY